MAEIIVGIISVLGGIILLLNKFGLIHFGKRSEPVEKVFKINEGCKLKQCPSHDDFVSKLGELHDAHIVSHNLHKQHALKFANGKEEFDEIKETLKFIGENIAVLKDRSDREEMKR